jgi:hypothetical protein
MHTLSNLVGALASPFTFLKIALHSTLSVGGLQYKHVHTIIR